MDNVLTAQHVEKGGTAHRGGVFPMSTLPQQKDEDQCGECTVPASAARKQTGCEQ